MMYTCKSHRAGRANGIAMRRDKKSCALIGSASSSSISSGELFVSNWPDFANIFDLVNLISFVSYCMFHSTAIKVPQCDLELVFVQNARSNIAMKSLSTLGGLADLCRLRV